MQVFGVASEDIVMAAAVLGALAYLVTKAVGWVRNAETVGKLIDGEVLKRLTAAEETLQNIEKLLESELTHNHGSSIKDDVYGVARGLGQMQRVVEDVAMAQQRTDARVGLLLSLQLGKGKDET